MTTEDAKLRDYLLSPIHPVGRYKWRFFLDIGYETSHWEALRQDLMSLVATEDAQEGAQTRYGQKYVVSGNLGKFAVSAFLSARTAV
jgi:hypothetical protein